MFSAIINSSCKKTCRSYGAGKIQIDEPPYKYLVPTGLVLRSSSFLVAHGVSEFHETAYQTTA